MLLIGAVAATPLVAGGADAVEAARESTGRADWELVSWDDVRRGEPSALSGAELVGCPGSAPDVETALQALTSAVLNALEVEAATRGAMEAAACHGGAPETLARIGLLAGVAAAEAGDTAGAERWFGDALALNAALDWDPDFSERFRGPFDAAREGLASADRTLEIAPEGGRVDGSALVAVRPGWHLVEAGATRLWIEVRDASDTVVIPAAFPDEALGWAADDTRRRALSLLLAAHLGEGVELGVHVDGTTWTGRAGRADWRSFAPEVPSGPDPAPEPRGRRPGKALAAVGLAVLAAGAGTATASYLYAQPDGSVSGRFTSAEQRAPWAAAYWAGWGAVAAGGGLAGVGITLELGGKKR